jgi:hypothetical protein
MTWLRNITALLAFSLFVTFAASTSAVTVRMVDGTLVSGDVNAYSDRGLILKMADGTFQTFPWAKITTEALAELRKEARLPRERENIDPFLPFNDPGPTKTERVLLKDPERPSRPTGATGLFGLLGSGIGFFLLVLLYAANLGAAYEVAIYRKHPTGIALGGAAILPVIAPFVLYFGPESWFRGNKPAYDDNGVEASNLTLDLGGTRFEGHEDEIKHSATNQRRRGNTGQTTQTSRTEQAEQPAQPQQPARQEQTSQTTSKPKPKLKLEPQGVPTVLNVFERGKVVFNRRFFETKLGPFLKVVPPAEAEGKQIVFETHRGVFVGTKLSAIEQTHIDLFVDAGGASSVEKIPFIEIQSVRIEQLG